MKIRLLRLVKDWKTKEEKQILEEVKTEWVQCVYRDRNGVFLSLDNGFTIKVDHSFDEMIDAFID